VPSALGSEAGSVDGVRQRTICGLGVRAGGGNGKDRTIDRLRSRRAGGLAGRREGGVYIVLADTAIAKEVPA
jgi:hypothetical protein